MQLAQLNIAEALYPMDDPRMDGFTGRINMINELADRSDGFIWRLVDEDDSIDGALNIRFPGGSEHMIVNMSVWRDIESLYGFVYKTAHKKLITAKSDWFENLVRRHIALWWVPDGHIPSLLEAHQKLTLLETEGETAKVFSFNKPYDITGQPITAAALRKAQA